MVEDEINTTKESDEPRVIKTATAHATTFTLLRGLRCYFLRLEKKVER
jgi:hypothetical protein